MASFSHVGTQCFLHSQGELTNQFCYYSEVKLSIGETEGALATLLQF